MFKKNITILMAILLLSLFSFTANSAETGSDFKLKPTPELQNEVSDRFPGDPAEHKAIYMWNRADTDYQHGILNSIKAMIQRYGDNIDIAVVAIGSGLHALAKEPKREVAEMNYARIASFANDYNVRWIACGNTMKTIQWEDKDMRPFAEYAEVGAAALMELQEEGYKLLVW